MSPAENEEADGDHTCHDGDDLLATHDQVVAEDARDHYKTDHHDGGDDLGHDTGTPAEFFDGARHGEHGGGGQRDLPAQRGDPAERRRHFGAFNAEGGAGEHHGRRIAPLACDGDDTDQQERHDHTDDDHGGGLPERDAKTERPCAI